MKHPMKHPIFLVISHSTPMKSHETSHELRGDPALRQLLEVAQLEPHFQPLPVAWRPADGTLMAQKAIENAEFTI
jgi:hypothetical protein